MRRGPLQRPRGPVSTATLGTRACGVSPDTSPGALFRGCHSGRGPAEVCRAGREPPGLRADFCGPSASGGLCGGLDSGAGGPRGPREASGRRCGRPRPRPFLPGTPPPGSGCSGVPPSLEGRILVWRCDGLRITVQPWIANQTLEHLLCQQQPVALPPPPSPLPPLECSNHRSLSTVAQTDTLFR